MSQGSDTPEQPEKPATPQTPAEPAPPATPPPATPAMPPPTTPPMAPPAVPVAGAVSPGQGGLAIAAFICGLGGIFTSWCCIGLPLAIAAVVCGILGKNEAEKRGASNWMWMTGLILGAISLLIFVAVVIGWGLNTNLDTSNFNNN